jgi:hypothetical protein
MKTFREIAESIQELNEADVLYAWYTDPMGNKQRFSSKGGILNSHGVSKGITSIQYIINKRDVTAETGNSGTKHYTQFIKTRLEAVNKKAKNNKSFAKEMNKAFNTDIFTDKELF